MSSIDGTPTQEADRRPSRREGRAFAYRHRSRPRRRTPGLRRTTNTGCSPLPLVLPETRCRLASETPPNEGHPGSHRVDRQRHGADRAGRLPLADVPDPGRLRRPDGRLRHLVRHLRRPAAVHGHRHLLRGAVEALPRRRVVVLLRRTGLPQQDARLQVRPHRQVHHRLGQPPLLLGLPRPDGRRDGPRRRLHGRRPLAPVSSVRRWPARC